MASIRVTRLPKKLVAKEPVLRGTSKLRDKKSNNPHGRPPMYPFRTVEIGEGFRIPPEVKGAHAAATYVHQRNRALAPKKFKTTYLTDGGIYVARVA
jgi:hypothetical protein